jgi:predicted Zn-dependent peptidase
MKSINISKLDNGLRVVSERLPQVESAALGLLILGGLEVESDRVLGIGHYLEHMLFKGTAKRTARQISEEIDGVGGHLNGYTDREYVCLYVHLLAEHLPLALDVLFDMTFNSTFTPVDVDKEREVIIQESRRLEDNPEEQVHDIAIETAWQGHPLGRSLHGNEATIRAIMRDDLITHFRSNYTPDKMLITAAGAIDHEKLVDLVRNSTAELKKGQMEAVKKSPSFNSEQKSLSRTTEQVHVCLALPGCAQTDKDRYAMVLFDSILGGASSSRLFQEIRENRGLVYSIGSYSFSCRNAGLFLIHAGTGGENLSQVLELISEELDKISKHGVSEAELERVKAQVHGTLALARESTAYRMQRLVHSILYEGKVVRNRELLRRFEVVSQKDIHRVAEKILSASPTLITLGPI